MNELSYYSSDRPEVAQHLDFIPEGAKILEVGCGTGHFRKLIRSKNNEYWGVEPLRLAAVEAETRLDKVLIGTYDEVKIHIPDHFFDYVICLDVIEHMEDPWRFIQEVKDKMKKPGIIISSIPNFRYIVNIANLLINRTFQYAEAGILDRTHLRFYTKKSIVGLYEDSGFRIKIHLGINKYYFNSRTFSMILLSLIYPFLLLLLGRDIQFFQYLTIAELVSNE